MQILLSIFGDIIFGFSLNFVIGFTVFGFLTTIGIKIRFRRNGELVTKVRVKLPGDVSIIDLLIWPSMIFRTVNSAKQVKEAVNEFLDVVYQIKDGQEI